ncbi:hypothetical protein LSH36_257g01005 [Paralvinella palmiformis]|uniref:Uncharacterized protein n=1 Tax=Paralvinella palmiformis TaxID=53620 RepID=A0AAD9N4J4_9ANNE|nr:hypothetical protein LSH36_257g01005 [Paralvinella palmiformis]
MSPSAFKPLHSILALVTVVVCVFDIITNWYTFSQFIGYQTSAKVDRAAAIFLGCAAAVGTLVLFLVLLNLMRGLEAYSAEKPEQKQESVARWQEVAFFLQIVVEDSVVAVVVYWTFKEGSCALYAEIFRSSITANVALVGALSGSVWKTICGIVNCVCGCVTEAETGCGWALMCCLCRIAMNIVTATLIGFVGYQLINYNQAGFEKRLDCQNATHNTIYL